MFFMADDGDDQEKEVSDDALLEGEVDAEADDEDDAFGLGSADSEGVDSY